MLPKDISNKASLILVNSSLIKEIKQNQPIELSGRLNLQTGKHIRANKLYSYGICSILS